MSAKQNQSPESVVREIRRNTRRKYTAEEKSSIALRSLKTIMNLTIAGENLPNEISILQ